MRFDGSAEWTPRLVAESLVAPRDLLLEALDPGPRVSGADLARSMAGALLPPEAADQPPAWLRPAQERSFRRCLAALRGYGGALLADPLGSGKTYVALAAGIALAGGGAIQVVVPAILAASWREAAARTGVAVELLTHERLSRGPAALGPGPVVIDESHRFRNPQTRRYRHAAPALIGRRVLLVSATPLVNALSDLAHQLLLAVPDDALRAHGVASLRAALARGPAPAALAALVVAEARDPEGRPRRRDRREPDWLERDTLGQRALAVVDRLRLSRDPGVAALVRTALLRALASSPAALHGMVRRYALLLAHARAARRAGRRPGRQDLFREAGVLPEQLVLWELLGDPGADPELALGDEAPVRRLERLLAGHAARADPKAEVLAGLLADRRPTLVFTAWTETVDYLRRRLAQPGLAWVNGARAGIGPCRYGRGTVLSAFDPAGAPRLPDRLRPWLLLATDVAAEGLNLQRVARVVHYDLPWTQVRVDQRDGRALRLGSVQREVEVIRFDPPAAIDARLELVARLERKASLPEAIRLGAAEAAWTWQRDLPRDRQCPHPAAPGWAAVAADRPAAVIVLRLRRAGAPSAGIALVDEGSGWRSDPGAAGALLGELLLAPDAPGHGPETVRAALSSALPHIRRHLRIANASAWMGEGPGPATAIRRARDRLAAARLARDAAAERDADRVLSVLARGRTAGEEQLVNRLATDPEAWARLAAIGALAAAPAGGVAVELVGVVVGGRSGQGGQSGGRGCEVEHGPEVENGGASG